MFEQTFVQTGKTNKGWTVVLSTVIQLFIIGIFVLMPMIYFDVLPAASLQSLFVAPPPPPPPPPPPAQQPKVQVVHVIPRQFDAGKLMAPKTIPKDIAMIKEDELPPPSSNVVGIVGGTASGPVTGLLNGIIGGTGGLAAPPPPPPPKPVTPQRIRVGGNVQAANLITQIKPVYPPLAKQARIQGTVELSAIIGKDGRVQDLKVVRGHPLLVQSALEAVKNWIYRPTMLNGEPVEVSTTIDVNFTLQ
ncbi:MAG: energy transducer TonB [Bryobacteraceae bacterium]